MYTTTIMYSLVLVAFSYLYTINYVSKVICVYEEKIAVLYIHGMRTDQVTCLHATKKKVPS